MSREATLQCHRWVLPVPARLLRRRRLPARLPPPPRSGDDDGCKAYGGPFKKSLVLAANTWYWFALGPYSTTNPPTITARLNLAAGDKNPEGSFGNPYLIASLPYDGPSYSVGAAGAF